MILNGHKQTDTTSWHTLRQLGRMPGRGTLENMSRSSQVRSELKWSRVHYQTPQKKKWPLDFNKPISLRSGALRPGSILAAIQKGTALIFMRVLRLIVP